MGSKQVVLMPSSRQGSKQSALGVEPRTGSKKVSIMLPTAALEVNTAAVPSAAPSPMSRPTCTPTNVATTHWRTVVCPHPPVKHTRHLVRTTSSDLEDVSSGGLTTPSNLWPTPTNATPRASPMAISPFGAPGASFGFGDLSMPRASPQLFRREPLLSPNAAGRESNPQPSPTAFARLQTITDNSPSSMANATGYPAPCMNVSMEVDGDWATPSPDQDRRGTPWQLQSQGPMTPDDKPVMVRSQQFRCSTDERQQ